MLRASATAFVPTLLPDGTGSGSRAPGSLPVYDTSKSTTSLRVKSAAKSSRGGRLDQGQSRTVSQTIGTDVALPPSVPQVYQHTDFNTFIEPAFSGSATGANYHYGAYNNSVAWAEANFQSEWNMYVHAPQVAAWNGGVQDMQQQAFVESGQMVGEIWGATKADYEGEETNETPKNSGGYVEAEGQGMNVFQGSGGDFETSCGKTTLHTILEEDKGEDETFVAPYRQAAKIEVEYQPQIVKAGVVPPRPPIPHDVDAVGAEEEAGWEATWAWWSSDAVVVDGWRKLCWRQVSAWMDSSGLLIGGPLELAWEEYGTSGRFVAFNLHPETVATANQRFGDLYLGEAPPVTHQMGPVYCPVYQAQWGY